MATKVGQRIRTRRMELGMDQLTLAERANLYSYDDDVRLARETISKFEHDRVQPGVATLRALAIALDTTTDYLLSLDDSPGTKVASRPVPTVDLAPLVAQLNAVDDELRKENINLANAGLRLARRSQTQVPVPAPAPVRETAPAPAQTQEPEPEPAPRPKVSTNLSREKTIHYIPHARVVVPPRVDLAEQRKLLDELERKTGIKIIQTTKQPGKIGYWKPGTGRRK